MAQRKKKRAFRLRSKPEKPKRWTNLKHEYSMYSGQTVASLLEVLEKYGVDPKDAAIEKAYGRWGDDDEVSLVFTYTEVDKEYQKRLKAYKKKLAAWEAWYAENEEAIKAELDCREGFVRERVAKAEEKIRARTRKQIAEMERRMARMKESIE